MKKIKTFEGFLSNIFGKSSNSNKSSSSKKNNFSIFSKEHDSLAEKVLKSLQEALQFSDNKSRILGDIKKVSDYRRSVKFQSKEGNLYNITINKTSTTRRTTSKIFGATSGDYKLVINNKHYNVSNNICKKIWDLLDKNYDKKYYNADNIEKDFE
jgi:hypothetical protein